MSDAPVDDLWADLRRQLIHSRPHLSATGLIVDPLDVCPCDVCGQPIYRKSIGMFGSPIHLSSREIEMCRPSVQGRLSIVDGGGELSIATPAGALSRTA
jgi:hypothetical protein